MNPAIKNAAIVGTLVVASFVGLWLAWKFTSKPATPQKIDITIQKDDWTKGNKEASVVLVEYSDLQCPACRAFYPLVKQVVKDNKNDVLFVYRHFPLQQHKNANVAAYAAEAAGIQKKFFEIHDMLFENQDEWAESGNPEEIFVEYAKELELDVERFKKEMDSQNVKEKVDRDQQSGLESGVNSTPTFFLNGEKIQNPQTVEAFDKLIKEAQSQ